MNSSLSDAKKVPVIKKKCEDMKRFTFSLCADRKQ